MKQLVARLHFLVINQDIQQNSYVVVHHIHLRHKDVYQLLPQLRIDVFSLMAKGKIKYKILLNIILFTCEAIHSFVRGFHLSTISTGRWWAPKPPATFIKTKLSIFDLIKSVLTIRCSSFPEKGKKTLFLYQKIIILLTTSTSKSCSGHYFSTIWS